MLHFCKLLRLAWSALWTWMNEEWKGFILFLAHSIFLFLVPLPIRGLFVVEGPRPTTQKENFTSTSLLSCYPSTCTVYQFVRFQNYFYIPPLKGRRQYQKSAVLLLLQQSTDLITAVQTKNVCKWLCRVRVIFLYLVMGNWTLATMSFTYIFSLDGTLVNLNSGKLFILLSSCRYGCEIFTRRKPPLLVWS